jgi:hypothetical protein
MHVFYPVAADVDVVLAIQLEDATVHKVRVSDKGTLWDLAD